MQLLSNGRLTNSGSVFLVVASSRPDLIDPALLRPGRIDRHIFVGLPSVTDRIAILSLALQLPLQPQPQSQQGGSHSADELREAIEQIARSEKAQLMTPADLKALVGTANLLSAHEYISSLQQRRGNLIQLSPAAVPSIQNTHLITAFQQTKPSLSSEDLDYYNSIYNKFRPDSSESARPKVNLSDDSNKQLRMSLK